MLLDRHISLAQRFLMLFFILANVPEAMASKSDVERSKGRLVKMTAPLPNFHEVHPFLYRGGQPDSEGLHKLDEMGIKTVIDLRAQSAATRGEKAKLEGLGIKYINLPMSDQAPTARQVDIFTKTVKEAKEKNEPLFLHCAHGSDRTGCLVGIWRVTEDGYSYEQAYKEMLKYYFGRQFTKLSAAVKSRAAK